MDTRIAKKKLESLKQDLQKRLDAIEDDLTAELDDDSCERAVQTENDQVLLALLHDGRKEKRAIEHALLRIANNSYGRCCGCGRKIPQARLDALPFTPYCLACARRGSR